MSYSIHLERKRLAKRKETSKPTIHSYSNYLKQGGAYAKHCMFDSHGEEKRGKKLSSKKFQRRA